MNFIFAITFITLVSTSYAATAADEPTYLKYRSDSVQQVYSTALIGFAFDRKCKYLSTADQAVYEKQLNIATEIFQGYILAKEIVRSPEEAVRYPRDMVLGTIRYSNKSACDPSAKERVFAGFDAAKNFMSHIDGELEKKIDQ